MSLLTGAPLRGAGSLLEPFLPKPEFVERHDIDVAAPVGLTFECARELRMRQSRIVRSLFFIRTLPARLLGQSDEIDRGGLLEEALSLGWGLLAERPGRAVVLGAVTQPWQGIVEFCSVPPDQFAAFHEPGYAKIVWTLEALPIGPAHSLARTETRVATTDAESRRRFRRYWRLVAPGIVLIRIAALRIIRREAERRVRMERRAA